jgi:hypothetical protein
MPLPTITPKGRPPCNLSRHPGCRPLVAVKGMHNTPYALAGP